MACGCGGNKSNQRSRSALRPASVQTRSLASGLTASQLRPQQTQSPHAANINTGGIDAERRKVQALRRAAIQKALNK
jgi:hypothetical protein